MDTRHPDNRPAQAARVVDGLVIKDPIHPEQHSWRVLPWVEVPPVFAPASSSATNDDVAKGYRCDTPRGEEVASGELLCFADEYEATDANAVGHSNAEYEAFGDAVCTLHDLCNAGQGMTHEQVKALLQNFEEVEKLSCDAAMARRETGLVVDRFTKAIRSEIKTMPITPSPFAIDNSKNN